MSFSIAKHLIVLQSNPLHSIAEGQSTAEDPLLFLAVKPDLNRLIVVSVPLATHKTNHLAIKEQSLKGTTGVSTTSIGVMNQIRKGFGTKKQHAQRINQNINRLPKLERPPNHIALKQFN